MAGRENTCLHLIEAAESPLLRTAEFSQPVKDSSSFADPGRPPSKI